MKLKLYLTVLVLTAFLLGLICGMQDSPDEVAERHIADQQVALDRVPTIKEIQRKVGAKEDGKLCEMWNVPGHSETQKKWEKALCNQYTIESMERMAGDKK